ncbi:MAG: YciI family protein [Actinomycetota bacterium]|nr:YciI family protein [Actinomycetota bacterium]
MANYLVLIYENEADWIGSPASTTGEVTREHEEFAKNNRAALRGGAQLRGSDTATSIRHGADGNAVVTDGTFAETKEVLGGYYVIEAADLDEALAVAKQVPARFGGVEVRPLVAM